MGTVFKCKRCKGEIPLPSSSQTDLKLSDGTAIERVEKFCYLGDMINVEGGAEMALITRLCKAWSKFRERSPLLTSTSVPLKVKGKIYKVCVRSCLLYGSETWAIRKEMERKMECAEMRMIRRMCKVTMCDKVNSAELRERVGVDNVRNVVRTNRLRWYGHVKEKREEDWVKKCVEWEMVGEKRKRGRPKLTWKEVVRKDMEAMELKKEDVYA